MIKLKYINLQKKNAFFIKINIFYYFILKNKIKIYNFLKNKNQKFIKFYVL